jgi:alpha-glucosidase
MLRFYLQGVLSVIGSAWILAAGNAYAQPTLPSTNTLSAAPVVEAPSDNPSRQDPWWKHAVFYEIYPRSFADSNGDGMGDLNGITSRLDYLKSLGVDALWLTPIYPSPQVDFGYDISDYRNIAPEYGTLADFDRLVAEAKKRNIRIIMDLVMNHTSDKHPWFEESRSSKTNPKRNWYIWRDGKPAGQPPNNWLSVFGHSAWKFDPKTKQYYYHFFYPEQPDLNWRNPDVKNAMYDVARFWLDRGVAGFRLDAVMALFEDPALRDNPILPGKNQFGDPNMFNKYNDRLPEVHDVLRGLRKVLDSYPGNRVLIGETSANAPSQLATMYGKNLDEIQLPMNFFFAYVNKLSAPEFRKQIAIWDRNKAGGWPVYLFSNHDQPRHYVRYGDALPESSKNEIAKLMATMLLTLRGTPILYYGEEIGMENNDPKRKEDVKDPIGRIGWPKEKGRDGERTPMQWSAAANAGFSEAKPWLPVAPDFKTTNVSVEETEPGSVLSFYKELIALRRKDQAIRFGSYKPLNESDKNVLSYLRQSGAESVLIALNMSPSQQTVAFDSSQLGSGAKQAETLIASPASQAQTVGLDKIVLPPYGVYIGKIKL